MVERASELAERAEIPWAAREQMEFELRRDVFDRLHAEAVQQGLLPPAPRAAAFRLPGRLLSALFALLAGALLGLVATLLALFLIRTLGMGGA